MNERKHILVADPDGHWRQQIAQSIASPSLEVATVDTGDEALAWAQREKPDLVLLELVLPAVSGLGLCRLLREDPALGHVGIIMVTHHVAEVDRMLAFEAGVDDVLTKPFYERELASRVRAVLRRSGRPGALAVYPVPGAPLPPLRGSLSLHSDSHEVVLDERRIDLTPREHQLLAALVGHAGRVLTRKQLIARIWSSESEQTDRVVDAHVKSIRRKLGEAGRCLETVRGVGYRFSYAPVPDLP